MNKQQLIDKAIDDLGGHWPALDFCKPYTVLYYLNCRKDAELATKVTDGGVEVTTKICTKKEFEARKAEREKDKQEAEKMLGMINSSDSLSKQNHWYDYENQKALRLPPVGEVVEFMRGIHISNPLKVLAYEDGSVILWRKLDSSARSIELAKISFRPLDWSKLRISAVNEITDIIESYCVDVVSAASITDAILAAGYRKCHNNTPPDKE